jgi:hypothetical protein
MNKKIIASALTGIILLSASGIALKNNGTKAQQILNDLTPALPWVEKEPETVKELLSCYDFIDQLLAADGFKHLEGAKWGRGEKNHFIIDIEKGEFHYADLYNPDLTKDWYVNDFDTFVQNIYSHKTGEIIAPASFRYDPNQDPDNYTITKEELKNKENRFYDLPFWMTRYIEEATKFSCSLNDLTKTRMSTAEAKDVVSSFDLVSTDGVLRTFNDVHKPGDVKDDPRFKEITSLEEYAMLDTTPGLGGFYMINILYNNAGNYTFEKDRNGLSAKVIEEFVKDVVYPNTHIPSTDFTKKSFGVYFIYADNPNFKYLYTVPGKTPLKDNSVGGKNISRFNMPFEGTVLLANKATGKPYEMHPLAVGLIRDALANYIVFIKHYNPSIHFSDDFMFNYTRPFDITWQTEMGLSEFFDVKYGFINRDVRYLH